MASQTTLKLSSETLSGRVELLDNTLVPVFRSNLAPFFPVDAAIAPGQYQLMLRLNDGRVVRQLLVLEEGKPVSLAAEAIVRDELPDGSLPKTSLSGFRTVSRSAAAPQSVEVALGVLVPPIRLEGRRETDDPYLNYGGEISLSGGPGEELRIKRSIYEEDPKTATAHVAADMDGYGTSRFSLILPRFDFALKIPELMGGGAHIETAVNNPAMQTMFDVLAANAPVSPGVVFDSFFAAQVDTISEYDEVDKLAYRLVEAKFRQPDLAAGAAWYLYKINRLEVIRDWTRNLSDYFLDLPDGAVLEGWRRLSFGVESNTDYPSWRLERPPPATATRPEPNARRPDNPLEDAAVRFAEAVHRGPPRFSLGVEELAAGLEWCAGKLPESKWPEGLEKAQLLARIWRASLIKGTVLTTFRAELSELQIDTLELERRSL